MNIHIPSIVLCVLLMFLSCRGSDRPRQEVSLAAVGDIMLGRYIGKVVSAKGAHYPFDHVRTMLRQHTVVLGNLESGIAEDTSAPFFPGKPYNFAASPIAASGLRDAGFTVLGLANNHMLDFGPDEPGLTGSLLRKQDLSCFGAGENIGEARQPALLVRSGVRFGFLGYGIAHSRAVYAKKNRAGIAPIIMSDIRKDILALRGRVDVLIVSLHWGIEYEKRPTGKQRVEAHQIIDWGADVIIGHHPHVMQGIEIYKNKVIAYSLGNFLFDQKGAGTDRSFVLTCRFREKTLYSAEIIPLDRYRSYFPKVAEGSTGESIIKDLENISTALHSQIPFQRRIVMDANPGERTSFFRKGLMNW
jgi:poly-gamma-glutamate capsule biosynthesis protein CapA/YwtB (metallophosphatase superfamily)